MPQYDKLGRNKNDEDWRILVYLKAANTRVSLHGGLMELSAVFGRFMILSVRFDSSVITWEIQVWLRR